MNKLRVLKSALVGGASIVALAHPAAAKVFDIPGGDLNAALDSYMKQSGVQIIYLNAATRGHRSPGARGDYSEIAALTQVLRGTGFTTQPMPGDVISIVPQQPPAEVKVAQAERKSAAPPPPQQSGLETVVVTAQKRSEDIQTVPIAITALSQQQLTERQIAGGPDLVKEVPNLTFSKTNFSGYNLEIRGIGTQAISVTTDPAVAVAFNDTPFIRNHFFEQEFFDLDNVEVLRGPQGTLYGRNATAGVVNIISAKPTDSYEAMLSADVGNYESRRYEGMLNLPIVGDTLDLRVAGEWTKRDGYSFNDITNQPIDGRDLWSGRMTLSWKPTSNVQTYLVWEHFSEDDDRLRSGKQLCSAIPTPTEFEGIPVGLALVGNTNGEWLSQGCSDGSMYSRAAFTVPDGYTLPFWAALNFYVEGLPNGTNPYAGATQSTNLRVISSELTPSYKSKNDTLEYNADWQITPALTLTSQTGYNHDFLWSTEDYNRFATRPDVFDWAYAKQLTQYIPGTDVGNDMFCDPQLGCANRLEAGDLSEEHAWQFSQEFRLASNFDGPVNFNFGGNYLHYETVEDYYVFINTLTLISLYKNTNGAPPYQSGVSDNSWCLTQTHQFVANTGNITGCNYIDPNSLGSLNNQGHNYFLSQNPYVLNSYSSFGELYYDVAKDLKLTFGGRWTEDQKHFISIPSEVLTPGYGYPIAGVLNQQWDALTGRFVADWTPNLDFTDSTLIYFSASHGYKAGGANPPGAELLKYDQNDITNPIHPPTFKPEFIQAFELGTKNTALSNSLTLNGDIFYYNYTGYQISRIVDRSAINDNFNAHVEGAEFEANWEPLPGLKFSLAQGFESTALAGGSESVDLLDRTAGNPGWVVVKPFLTQASNCILPVYVVVEDLEHAGAGGGLPYECGNAYNAHWDPVTQAPYVPNPSGIIEYGSALNNFGPGIQYPGFDPLAGTPGDPYHGQNTFNGVDYGPVPNNGQGFDKNLSGHQLPNAPHFTTSLTAEYSMPLSEDWAATLHGDFYWQSQQWARVFEDPIDKIRPYSTTNVSLILSSANGWQIMAYVKNVFNVTAITGTFLNSDDTDLTTNVFLTDPRLFGVRVTKQLDQADGFWGSEWSGYDFFTGLFSDADNGKPPVWIELGGQFDIFNNAREKLDPPFFADIPKDGFNSPLKFENLPPYGFEESAKVSFTPDDSDWVFSASVRYGRNGSKTYKHQQTNNPRTTGIGAINPSAAHFHYVETTASDTVTHDIFDFMAGKDVGLGSLGLSGTSVLSGGLRFAQFRTESGLAVYSDPDYSNAFPNTTPPGPKYFHQFSARNHNKTSFTGIGPALSWNASTPVDDEPQSGQITFDWGMNGAVLFGRQKSQGFHMTKGKLSTGFANAPTLHKYYQTTHYTHSRTHNRSRVVAVPNLGGTLGLSFHYRNAKVSFGYRIDEFFGAMDGGIDQHKSYNFGDSGPFVNLSIGLGG